MISTTFLSLCFGLCAFALSLAHAVESTPPPLEFTAPEKEYLQKVGTIKMCVDPDWIPFERINEQGQHEGIAADLVQLVAQRVGLKIELYPVKTWEESLAASKGKICQIMSFLNQTPARDAWLIFTEPIFFDPNIIITREEHSFIGDPKGLRDERVALPRGTMVEERIRRDFPNLKLILTGSEQESVALVSERKADMTVRSLIVAAYAIKKEGLFNLKIAGQLPEYTNKLRIGVQKNEEILRAILDKGVKTLTPQEREAIANRHVSISVQQGIDYGLLIKVVLAALLLLAVGVYWNRRLSRFNEQLRCANEAVSALQKETDRALSQVATLLNNSAQGFLSFGGDLRVKPEFSTECTAMLGKHIAGAEVCALLYPDDAAARSTLQQNLLRILASTDEFKSEVLISLLPRLYRIDAATLRAQYKKLADGDLMLVLDDVTEELALQEQVRQEQLRLQFVVSVFKEQDDVRATLRDYERLLDRTGETVAVDDLFREIHTYKGVFAQFNFYHTPLALHEFETTLATRDRQGRYVLAEEWAPLRAALRRDVETLVEILGYDIFNSEEQVPIERCRLDDLENTLKNLPDLPELAAIRRQQARLRDKPFVDLLVGYPKYCLALAERLDKAIYPFKIEGARFCVDPERFTPFARSLVHVFRNAVDHGLEAAKDRAKADKDEIGRIVCQAEQIQGAIELTIADDGGGIDTARLVQKAAERGLPIPTDPLLLVFADAFSTRTSVTDLSGRGIGLAAVKEALDALQGHVVIETKPGAGTRFVFTLPLGVVE
jgi:ABC-type amino acid transport substrate-binding protein/signal transduction histidine kinase